MMRTWTVASVILVLFVTMGTGAAAPPMPQEALQKAQKDEPVLTGPCLPRAQDLEVRATCDRVEVGRPLAVFNWTLAQGVVCTQRVDVTPFRTGFKSRNFTTIGELKADQNTLEWCGGEAGINYYWRVLTRTPDGWSASEIGRYEVPTCPVDFEKPQKTAN